MSTPPTLAFGPAMCESPGMRRLVLVSFAAWLVGCGACSRPKGTAQSRPRPRPRLVPVARTPAYFLTHAGDVLALRFAAEDRLWSVGEDGHLRLWDLSSRKQLSDRYLGATLHQAFLSPDGSLAALLPQGGSEIQIHDLRAHRVLLTLETPCWGDNLRAGFAGETVALSCRERRGLGLLTYDTRRRVLLGSLEGAHGDPVEVQALAGAVAVVKMRDQWHVVELPQEQVHRTAGELPVERDTPPDWSCGAHVVSLTPDARWAAWGCVSGSGPAGRPGPSMWLWDLQKQRAARELPPGALPYQVRVSADGRRVGLAGGQRIVVHGASGPVVDLGYTDVKAVAFSRDLRRAAVGDAEGVIRVWDTASGKPIVSATPPHAVRELAFVEGSGGLVSVHASTADRPRFTVRWWSGSSGEPIRAAVLPATVVAVAPAPGGGRFALLHGEEEATSLELTDLGGGSSVRVKIPPSWGARFSADGATLLTRGPGGVTLRAARGERAGQLLKELPLPRGGAAPESVTVDRSGRRVAAACGGCPRRMPASHPYHGPPHWRACGAMLLWDAGRPFSLREGRGGFAAVAIAPDGSWLAGAAYAGLAVWRADGRRIERWIPAEHEPGAFYGGGGRGMVVSADGQQLAVADAERHVRVYDTGSWKQIDRVDLERFPDRAAALVFSADGRSLAVGTHRGAVHLFRRR